jgi:arsenate reductase-like glutaredoxin family protein
VWNRSWLESKKIAHAFHDYKAAGIHKATLEGWVKRVGCVEFKPEEYKALFE